MLFTFNELFFFYSFYSFLLFSFLRKGIALNKSPVVSRAILLITLNINLKGKAFRPFSTHLIRFQHAQSDLKHNPGTIEKKGVDHSHGRIERHSTKKQSEKPGERDRPHHAQRFQLLVNTRKIDFR